MSNCAFAQICAPTKNWGATTQYVNTFEAQDSIYVFFAGNTTKLVAQHSTNDTSVFVWKRYNPDTKDFIQFQHDSCTLSANAIGLQEGGYRVEITNIYDSTEVYTAWVFIDDVTITNIADDNNCLYMELIPKTLPNVWDVEYERFTYWDLSKPMHTVNNTYGKSYFRNVTWKSSESQIPIPDYSSLNLIVESPAPLYSSQYTVSIANPFGRTLTAQTTTIPAVAVKAKQNIKVFENNNWDNLNEAEGYEALLELSLTSEAINSDSIYWYASKRDYSTYDYAYVEFWCDSSEFNSDEILLDKSHMKPGDYQVKHIVKNSQSGCIDSVIAKIKVDSSLIKKEAIPNVFSPTVKDGTNDVFCFISPDENIRSMKSCSIRIFNRSGNLVHRYDGNPKDWKGWDGNVMDSGRLASQGIYYYIIECVGWDGRKFKRGPFKGTVHLY